MVKYVKKWEDNEDRKRNERDFIRMLSDLGWKLITASPEEDGYWVYQLTRE